MSALRAFLARDLWLVDPERAEEIVAGVSDDQITAWLGFADRYEVPAPYRRRGDAAIIDVGGVLSRTASFFSALFGGATYQGICAAVEAAEGDPAVNRLVFEIDSPGGALSGLWDAAQAITRCSKPTTSRVVGMAASAGLFLALAADEVTSGPLSVLGSIGMIYETTATAADNRVRFVSRVSPNKAATPDSDAGAAQYQALVDALGDEFVAWIAQRTGLAAEEIPARFGDGGLVNARRAHEMGLIHRIDQPDEGAPDEGADDEGAPMELEERIQQLERENEELRKQRDELQRKADEAEAEEPAEETGAEEDGAEMAAKTLADAEARFNAQTAKMTATALFRAGLYEGRVVPAEKTACVGRLTAALMGADDLPDDWPSVVAWAKSQPKNAAAAEWLSFFGGREPHGAVDLAVRTSTTATTTHASGPDFFAVRRELMSEAGLQAEAAAAIGFVGDRPRSLSQAQADAWIVTHAPALRIALAAKPQA